MGQEQDGASARSDKARQRRHEFADMRTANLIGIEGIAAVVDDDDVDGIPLHIVMEPLVGLGRLGVDSLTSKERRVAFGHIDHPKSLARDP